MRLLSKDELSKAKTSDRAREVAEGLKLSRRVDNLRELADKEEAALEKFRTESLDVISREIATADTRKEELLQEIKTLEAKFEGMLPEIGVKRKDLNALQKRLEKEAKELDEKSHQVKLGEIDIAIASKRLSDSLKIQLSHEEESQNLHRQALQDRTEAQQALEQARAIESNVLFTKGEQENGFALREYGISRRELALEERERENESIARELVAERVRLADQRATLERSLERLKHNRL